MYLTKSGRSCTSLIDATLFTRTLLLWVAWLLCFVKGFSQSSFPNYIPPSPVTADLFKHVDYPVDYSTGLTAIDIPLYEIKSGKLRVPISMSYRASGRKVYDENGPLGLGWTVNAGGIISRTIYGSADDDETYPLDIRNATSVSQSTPADFDYLAGVEKYPETSSQLRYDSEYDVFSVIINGKSGKFVLKDNDGEKEPVWLSGEQYVLRWTKSGDNRRFSSFEILDDEGIIYNFVPGEVSPYGNGYGYTSWLISSIVSADRVDTVKFEYNTVTRERNFLDQTYELTDSWIGADCITYPNPDRSDYITTNHGIFSIFILSEISFKEGKLIFNADDNPAFDYRERYMIRSIQILNKDQDTVRTIVFDRSKQDYILSNWNTYKINNVSFLDKEARIVEEFGFEYFDTQFTSDYPTAIHPLHRDYWGYYNASGSLHTVPRWDNIYYVNKNGVNTSYISVGHTDAIRDPDLDGLKSGVLTKITYPTGGTAEFVYEYNKYRDPTTQQIKNGPGMRIAEIILDDGLGNTALKTYRYGIDEDGVGICPIVPKREYMFREEHGFFLWQNQWSPSCIFSGGLNYRKRYFSSDFLPVFDVLANSPVIYPEVAEYLGSRTDNIGKTVYTYPVVQQYTIGSLFHYVSEPIYHISLLNYWNRNLLASKTEYARKSIGSGYDTVRKTQMGYSSGEIEYLESLRIRKNYSSLQTGLIYPVYPYEWPAPGGYPERYAATYLTTPYTIYAYGNYGISAGYKSLSSEITTEYQNGEPSMKTTMLYYYNSRHMVSKITKQTSISDEVSETNITYPFDYPSDPVLVKMVDSNMISFPIEKMSYLKRGSNSIHRKSIKNSYYQWNASPSRIALISTQEKIGTDSYRDITHYHDYDNAGNLLSFSRDEDIRTSYIWDYKSSYPIAEVMNANVSDIAYTSFESDGKGNWSFSGTAVTNSSAVTGKHVYNLAAGGISKGVSSSATYIVSYWRPEASSALTIAGTQSGYPKTGRTVNGWKYIEHLVSSQTSINVSGTGLIDELRLYPQNAQMTTYTYEPLIGMTGKCDVNGVITRYEYDGFGRLSAVRDNDNNIIKKYTYTYDGQDESNMTYYNTEKAGYFYRSNCTSCQTGSAVLYTVPANTYTSTVSQYAADSMANVDVASNGPGYANSHGSCSTPLTVSIIASNYSPNDVAVQFYNVCTGVSYYKTLYAYQPGTYINTVPQGTYHVYFTVSGGGGPPYTPYLYEVNGLSQVSSSSPIAINNVFVGPGYNEIMIEPN